MTCHNDPEMAQCQIGNGDGAVVTALVSHHCGLGSIPARAISGLSLLFVLAF